MRKKRIIIATSITAFLIVIVSVAFAALSTNLNIEFGKVTQNALTWNVGFKGSESIPTSDGTSDTGLSCGIARVTPSTVTISDSTLSKPGDKCTYPLTIENSGDIPAILNSIAMTEPQNTSCEIQNNAMTCGNVSYKLTEIDGTSFQTGITLNKREKHNFNLIIQYIGEMLNSTTITQSNTKITLTYVQSEKRSGDVPVGIETPIPKCKRATTLHTEECGITSGGCYANGYTEEGSKGTTTITYGSLGTSGTLSTGDAFDCDVNGDGTYDSNRERFYYISKVNGDNTSNYAVLVYYSNTQSGTDVLGADCVYSPTSVQNNAGPQTAYKHMPSTTQWSNVSLINQTRQIYSDAGTTSTTAGSLPLFTYTNKAARLLTYQEVQSGCGNSINSTKCEFLFERTAYSYAFTVANNYWLENPVSNSNRTTRCIRGDYRTISSSSAYSWNAARPVIEIALDDIEY